MFVGNSATVAVLTTSFRVPQVETTSRIQLPRSGRSQAGNPSLRAQGKAVSPTSSPCPLVLLSRSFPNAMGLKGRESSASGMTQPQTRCRWTRQWEGREWEDTKRIGKRAIWVGRADPAQRRTGEVGTLPPTCLFYSPRQCR